MDAADIEIEGAAPFVVSKKERGTTRNQITKDKPKREGERKRERERERERE